MILTASDKGVFGKTWCVAAPLKQVFFLQLSQRRHELSHAEIEIPPRLLHALKNTGNVRLTRPICANRFCLSSDFANQNERQFWALWEFGQSIF